MPNRLTASLLMPRFLRYARPERRAFTRRVCKEPCCQLTGLRKALALAFAPLHHRGVVDLLRHGKSCAVGEVLDRFVERHVLHAIMNWNTEPPMWQPKQ